MVCRLQAKKPESLSDPPEMRASKHTKRPTVFFSPNLLSPPLSAYSQDPLLPQVLSERRYTKCSSINYFNFKKCRAVKDFSRRRTRLKKHLRRKAFFQNANTAKRSVGIYERHSKGQFLNRNRIQHLPTGKGQRMFLALSVLFS